MNVLIGGQVGGCIDGRTVVRMYVLMDRQLYGCIDGWTDAWMY